MVVQSDETEHVCVEGADVVVVVALVVVGEEATQDEPDASKPERQPARSS